MKKIILSSLLCGSFAWLNAQTCTPFTTPCNTAYYTVLGPQEETDLATGDYVLPRPSKLYKTDPTTGALVQIGRNDMGVHINGLAYNPSDNFLYGMVDSTSFDRTRFTFEQRTVLYRIGSEACTQRMGTIIAPLNNPDAYASGVVAFVGDMDKLGNYYFPAFVVNSLDLINSTIDFDMYLGKIDASELVLGKTGYLPTYTKIDKNTCTALLNTYVLAYCQAVIQGAPRPNTGLQDWAYNPDDNTLWGYVATDKKFFRLPLPDPLNPAPLQAFCDDAPATFPLLANTELGGFFFDGDKNLHGLDPERGRYYTLDMCADVSCASIALTRQYTQDFTPITNPTFRNLRGDMAACAARTPITPSDEPFDCRTANLVVLGEQDKLDGAGNYTYAGKSQLYNLDVATGALTIISEKMMPVHLDALAISSVTGFAYGMSDSLRTENNLLVQNAKMYRIDNAGFTREWFEVQPPIAEPLETTLVLTQAGDMDNNGNYYFPALVLNQTNSMPPYVDAYTLFLGTIKAADFATSSSRVQPTYRKINIGNGCDPILFNSYIEALVASVIENRRRPLNGLQDWSFDAPTQSLFSFFAPEKILLKFDISDVNSSATTCIDVPALDNANGVLTAQLFGNNGIIYGVDTENALYYEIKECLAAGSCTPPTALISYTDAFSITKPDFIKLTGDGAACANRGGTLPVELAAFVGIANGCDAVLQWVTNSEKNNARFEVQKSTNGTDFVTMATLQGNGTTNIVHAYTYTDKTGNKQAYYRLKQTDFDGTNYFPSKVISVRTKCNNTNDIGVNAIYPNPTTALAALSFNASANETGRATWTLLDLSGRLVGQGNYTIVLDNNLFQIDLSDLPNGMYLLRLQGATWQSAPERIVKMQR